jgi:hypothetical protein
MKHRINCLYMINLLNVSSVGGEILKERDKFGDPGVDG